MTINNPWHDAENITELPVFLPHMTRNVSNQMSMDYDIQLSEEEWESWICEFVYKPMWIGIFTGILLDDVEIRRPNNMSMDIVPQGLDRFMHMDFVRSVMQISFPEDSAILPMKASLSETAPQQQVQAAIDHLAHLYRYAIPMHTPTLAQAELTLDIGGPRTYYRQRFFDSGGSALDAILAFNFEWVEVMTFQPDRPQWMYISLFPQSMYESLQLGSFPIITAEEAREILLQGYFISERNDTEWPGRDAALAASVELVYLNDHGTGPIMPFYRFLLKTDLPLWMLDEPGDWRAFARYYVPAIHQDFLEPMTRRAMPEPHEVPIGSRALPPHIFRATQTEQQRAPLRVPRHQVDDLWQEVLDDIGGLEVNEAYQFRTACGHYALITGTRNLIGIEELRQYYPHLGLPESVGDFTLREIFVNDRSRNMLVSYRPMSPLEQVFYMSGLSETETPPVGEIFTRDLEIQGDSIASAFYAVYVHSSGIEVGLGVSSLFFDLSFGVREPHTVLDMGEYGLIYFPGNSGHYYKAMYEHTDPWLGFVVELWFHRGSIDDRFNYLDLRYNYDQTSHLFTPVPREDLEELVQLFNPAALALEYLWDLMPWQ